MEARALRKMIPAAIDTDHPARVEVLSQLYGDAAIGRAFIIEVVIFGFLASH
jgi:hypothetical protein